MPPRPSILSLFDPLSNADDKENNVVDSSFFHPRSSLEPHVPTFRRRLVDVGDTTIDEPDMHDLLAEQEHLEDEIIHNIPTDDDNDTLTFRDMALAATPKWSDRRPPSNTTIATPLSSPGFPSPRTPLAELFDTDERTPVARKLKSYKRAIVSMSSKSSSTDIHETRIQYSPSSPAGLGTGFNDSPPRIEISPNESDLEMQGPSSPREVLGTSVCTLNLPLHSEASIADTPIPDAVLGSSVCTLDLLPSTSNTLANTPMPIFDSSSSSLESLEVPAPQSRLRPSLPSNDTSSRLSVDLQSSFQLHLNSSDTTFDLLNEKVSFFDSKDGMDSFLDNVDMEDSLEGTSFEDVRQFQAIPVKRLIPRNAVDLLADRKKNSSVATGGTQDDCLIPFEDPIETSRKAKHMGPIATHKLSSASSSPMIRNDREAKPLHSDATEKDYGISTLRSRESLQTMLEKKACALSTPCTSSVLVYPPRPVPALKIVKRSQISSQSNLPAKSSRRKSSITVPPPLTLRSNLRSASLEEASTSKLNGDKPAESLQSVKGINRVIPAQAPTNLPTNGNGPRRVLIHEGPKLSCASGLKTTGHGDQQKMAGVTSGPRRIVVAPAVAEKALPVTVNLKPAAGRGLKEPQKYSTIGPSSAIPKPIARGAGSKLPGPSRARFGVPAASSEGSSKGLPVRRVT